MKASRDEPMQLIGFDPQQRKFTINQEALEMIREIKGPIGVISVVGVYRTGKSFLTNRMLLNKKQGFRVSSTVQAETKGIWIWGKPILGQTSKNETINVLVLDTEGISSLDQEANYDMKVITMSILLSSLLIYNSIGAIQKNQVQTLSEVLKLVDRVSGKNLNTCPSLLWVLRDFSLQLKSSEHIILTPNQYLQQALKNSSSPSQRQLLSKRFNKIDCATLVRPLIDENSLQYLDIADYESLVPEFVDQLIQLRRKILNNVVPKSLNDKVLNGQAWADMAMGYLQELNSNKIPQLSNIWQYVCQSECRKHSEAAIDIFKNKLKQGLKRNVSEQSMKSLYKQAKQQAVQYMSIKCKNNTELSHYINQLKQSFSQEYMKIMNNLHKDHLDQIKEFLAFQYQSIERKLKLKQIPTLWEYKKQVQLFMDFARKKAGNSNCREYVGDFICKKIFQAASYFHEQVTVELQSKKQEFGNFVAKLEEQLKLTKKRQNQQKLELQTKIDQLEENNKQYLNQLRQLQETINQVRTNKQETDRQYWKQFTNQKSSFQKINNQLRAKISLSENTVDEINREKIILSSELKKKDMLYEKLTENTQQVLKDQKESYMKLLKEYSLLKQSYHNEIRVSDQKHGDKIKQYLSIIQQLRGSVNDYDAKFGQLKQNQKNLEERNRELDNERKTLNSQLIALKGEQQSESRLYNKKMAENRFKIEKNTHLQQEVTMLNEENARLKETNKQLGNQSDKQKALNEQKHHFIEIELKQSLTKNQQYQQKFKEILSNFNVQRLKLQQQLNQWRSKQFQTKKNMNLQQISMEELRTKNHDLRLALDQKEEQISSTIKMYKQRQQSLQNSKIILESQMRKLESENLKINRMNQKNSQQQIMRLNRQIQRTKEQYQSDIEDIKLAFEQTLGQIRNLHEIQKSRIQSKLTEQRNKREKKSSGIQNQEVNKNIRENNQKLQDQILQLKKKMWDDEKEYKIKVSQLETKITLKNSEIDEMKNNTTINIGYRDNDVESKVLKIRVSEQKRQIEDKNTEIKKLIVQNSALNQALKLKTEEINKTRLTTEFNLNQLQEELEQKRQQANIYKIRMMESMDDHSQFKRSVFNKQQSILNQNKYLQSKIFTRQHSPSNLRMSFMKKSRLEGKIYEALREVEAIQKIYGEAVRDVARKEQRHEMDLNQVKREKKVLQKKVDLMTQF